MKKRVVKRAQLPILEKIEIITLVIKTPTVSTGIGAGASEEGEEVTGEEVIGEEVAEDENNLLRMKSKIPERIKTMTPRISILTGRIK